MRRPWVAGNWKMNGSLQQITDLLGALKLMLPNELQAACTVFPPSIYIALAQSLTNKSSITVGAQNCYIKDSGAFTGEISASMIADMNCRYVLVGHSERRHLFKEDEKIVRDKFHHAKLHDIIPVLCVGETLAEYEAGLTEAVLTQQIKSVVLDDTRCFANAIVAYEPVWAIGTGKVATPEYAENAHRFIRALIAEFNPDDADALTLVYGGSVNAENAKSLFAMPNIDGGLVGGASLDAAQFVEIVKCIN